MPDPTIDDQLREMLPRLRRFALWLARDVSGADDLVQSTVERALTRWASRREDQALRAWLFAILYHQFIDAKRRARRYTAMLDLFRHNATEEQPSGESAFVARSVLQSLEKLPQDQRALLLWISVEGLSYQEAAQILDVPLGTVMSRLSRARQALRRLSDGDPQTPRLRLLK